MTGPAAVKLADLSPAGQALGRLVPQLYLSRDAALADHPLLRLLEVLAAPLADLEAATAALLDDHFVERARPEVLPLLADLVGARLLGTDIRTNRGVVAATIGWRRRQGSPPTLEEVLRVTTGWATEVDEAYRSVLFAQDVDRLLRHRGRTDDVTDPITVADPLTRPAPEPASPAAGDLVAQLTRLGAADALRPAVSARTLDLDGWVRPERVVVRTSRLAVSEVDAREIVHLLPVAFRDDPVGGPGRYVGLSLDPRGPHRDPAGDPVPFPLATARGDLLTPTALADYAPTAAADSASADAAQADAAQAADALTVFVDGVPLVGPPRPLPAPQPLPYAPPGPLAVLRFADTSRPSPGERWRLHAVAVDRSATIGTDLADATAEPDGQAGADNPAVLVAEATPGTPGAITVTAAGGLPRGGAQVALRLQRRDTAGYRRSGAGGWTLLPGAPRRGHPASPVVAIDGLPALLLARLERPPGGGIELALLAPDDAAPSWQATPVSMPGLATTHLGDLGEDGPLLAAVGGTDALLVTGPVTPDPHAPPGLGLWRIDGLGAGAPTVQRLDAGTGPVPAHRAAAAVCLAGGRLWLHGGQLHGDQQPGAVLADLWSIDIAGTAPRGWTRHRARHAPARTGARLLAVPGGLALLGGAETPGQLSASASTVDPAADRPAWQLLPALPIDAGPGTLWVRAAGAQLEVVAWPDRPRPRAYRLVPGERAWTDLGADTGDAPNPPAEGDAVFVGDQLVIPGPVPLPPSEVLLTVGGQGVLAFLPALDPADDAVDVLLVETDGGTRAWLPPGTTAAPNLRLGAGRDAPSARRDAPGAGLGVPGRLAWRPFRLRQVSLGRWQSPFALDLADAVGLDPRLGRVLAGRDVIAGGRLAASSRTGRAAAFGAGFAEPGRELPADWQEPPDPADQERFVPLTAPELATGGPGGPAPVTAWVLPAQVGEVRDGAPCVASLADAVRGDTGPVQVVGIPGSPRLEPATVSVGEGGVVSVFAAATGAVPHLAAEDGVSLSLQERLVADANPAVGPTWFLTGFSTDGAVELLAGAGRLDVRWCDLAPPRRDDPAPRTGLRVAGAGGDLVMPRWVLPEEPERTVVVRLVGCLVGRLEVPPWAQVIAAGCTFDAGRDDAVAIAAAGAGLRLRHCTLRGGVVAGVLEATSCVFRGALDCDRPDRGWLRHSVVEPENGRRPVLYRSVTQRVSLRALAATDPDYLLLDDNNPTAVLAVGERGLQPGAHGRRTRAMTELTERAGDFVPLGLVPHHLDRAAADLQRLNRRLA